MKKFLNKNVKISLGNFRLRGRLEDYNEKNGSVIVSYANNKLYYLQENMIKNIVLDDEYKVGNLVYYNDVMYIIKALYKNYAVIENNATCEVKLVEYIDLTYEQKKPFVHKKALTSAPLFESITTKNNIITKMLNDSLYDALSKNGETITDIN